MLTQKEARGMSYRALKEKQSELLDSMKDLQAKAEAFNRDLTATESKRFREMDTEIRRIGAELDIRRAENRLSDVPAGNQDRDGWNGWGPKPGAEYVDGDEVRALRPDESMRQYLRSRGADEYEGVTIGRLFRAAVLGPRSEAEERAMAVGADVTGGFIVDDTLAAGVIDRLRAKNRVMQAGAQLIPIDGETKFARVDGDPTVASHSENSTISDSDVTLGQFMAAPYTLAALVRASRELVEDASNLDSVINTTFGAAFASELDRVALLGTGANEATGVDNADDVRTVDKGTNGAPLELGDFLDLRGELIDADSEEPTAFIMSTREDRAFSKIEDGVGNPVQLPSVLERPMFLSTSKIPIDLTKGSSTDASRIYGGDFSRMWVLMRSDLRIEVLRERYADQLQYGFLAWLRYDILLTHDESFGYIDGVIP